MTRRSPQGPIRNPGRRRSWIITALANGEGINRNVLVRQFSVSRSTARQDIYTLRTEHPGLLAYDGHSKVYRADRAVLLTKFLPVINITLGDLACQ